MIATSHSLTAVCDDLSFPTSIAFDDAGLAYVAESGLPFGGAPSGGCIWRVEGDRRVLIADQLHPPVNGLAIHEDRLYVSEGGNPARITSVDTDGRGTLTVLDGLPGPGNYHTNMTAFGPDGKLYFSQGAMTNTGVVGLDAYEIGWLRTLPHAHDLPGLPIALTGQNFETPDPRTEASQPTVLTGAFSPFGSPTEPGDRVSACLPCTAAVMRCDPDGSHLELVAWGLRNAFGLLFLPDGRLLATDQGADDRGSRPVGNVPDHLFEVKPGAWYGWPDFMGGVAVDDARFAPARGPRPNSVLSNHAELPPPERPLVTFPAHTCAVKLDCLPPNHPIWPGQILVALFGDERPMTAPAGPSAGRAIARIDPKTWTMSLWRSARLERPIDVRVNPIDGRVYVVDFGRFEVGARGSLDAKAGSGGVFRLELPYE